MSMRLKGVPEVIARLEHIIAEKQRETLASLREHTDMMTDKAKENAPVRSGYLQDHIEPDVQSDGAVHTGTATSHADYSEEQEFGANGQEGKHFMSKAFNEVSPKFKSDLERIAKRDR